MPVDSTKAMPSSTSRSDVRGRPVRPCPAGGRGRISGSTSAHSSSLISRDGGEDTDDDMPPQPPPTLTRSRTDTPIRTRRHLQRLLKALAHVQDVGTGADPTFAPRCAPVVAAVAAVAARAGGCPGRWARPGGPSDARVLAALALLTLQAVRPAVEADSRRLGELAGVSRETARRALGRLTAEGRIAQTAEGWIAQTAAAPGIHAARWRLAPPAAAGPPPPAHT